MSNWSNISNRTSNFTSAPVLPPVMPINEYYAMPYWLVAGILAVLSNVTILSIIFTGKKQFRRNYLMHSALAIGDLINGLYFVYGTLDRWLQMELNMKAYLTLHTAWKCVLKPWVSLSTLGSQIPCVISVIMAVERYISVKYPFWYHVHVKYSTRLKMIFGAFFLCFVSLIGQFIGAYFDTEIKFPRGMCATSLAAPYWYYVLHYTVILTGHTIAFIVTCTVYFLAHRATNVLASQANLSLRSQLNAARQRTRRSHTTTNQSSGGNVLHLEQDRQHHREAWQSSQQQSHNSTNESPLNGPRRKFGVVHQNPTDNIKASSSGLARRHLKTEPHGVTAQVNRSEHLLGQPNGEDLRVHGETSEQHQELRTRLESIHAQLPEFQSQRARTTSVHHITPYETQISASVHQQQQENLQNQKDVQYIKTLLAVSLLSVLLIVIPNGLVLMVRSQTFLADLSVSIIGGRQRIPKIFTLYCANSIVNLFVYLVFLRPFRARFFKLVFHVNIPSTHGFGQVQPILSIPVHNSRNLSNFDRHTIEI